MKFGLDLSAPSRNFKSISLSFGIVFDKCKSMRFCPRFAGFVKVRIKRTIDDLFGFYLPITCATLAQGQGTLIDCTSQGMVFLDCYKNPADLQGSQTNLAMTAW